MHLPRMQIFSLPSIVESVYRLRKLCPRWTAHHCGSIPCIIATYFQLNSFNIIFLTRYRLLTVKRFASAALLDKFFVNLPHCSYPDFDRFSQEGVIGFPFDFEPPFMAPAKFAPGPVPGPGYAPGFMFETPDVLRFFLETVCWAQIDCSHASMLADFVEFLSVFLADLVNYSGLNFSYIRHNLTYVCRETEIIQDPIRRPRRARLRATSVEHRIAGTLVEP